MVVGQDKGQFSSDILREGEDVIIKINCEGYAHVPSIEDDGITMGKVIDLLIEVGDATKIVLFQKRNFEYDYTQTLLLSEIAKLYKDVIKKEGFSYGKLVYNKDCTKCINGWYSEVKHIFTNLFKSDPIGAYVELKRLIIREKAKSIGMASQMCGECIANLISVLTTLLESIEKTKLISMVKSELAGYKVGDRNIYRRIFSPTIKPDFMFTKLMSNFPANGEEMDSYTVGDDTEITIFQVPDTILYLYHMLPPEFTLSEEEYELLDNARSIMAEHKPKKSEFVNPERMREVFHNVGYDLMEELVGLKKKKISSKKIDKLVNILVRYTVGFGLVEVLLQDEKVQDISINSPMGELPIFIVHGDFGDCKTNIIPTKPESESWASKLRMLSGRPLDEANPILDTEISLAGTSARTSTLTQPLSPQGFSFSFRRHRDKPWTLPLFIKNKMINPLAAGVISFLIDGTRTFFICGTRGSGKTSFLSACMIEIMRKYRLITLEDTLEIPFGSFKKLGFNIVQMKVASALAHESNEFTATDGIRSTLRMGDSSLFVGEVRSKEAISLFEAMRVGAGSNVVGGTFHADTPYGVFDRCVNAIGIPATSFKALDCCIIANPIRSADGLHMQRRVIQITEVRKSWNKDPLDEGGFVDLLKYDARTDQLEPSSDLINGESDIIKAIAANVKDWAGNWDAVWDNIQLRAKVKEEIVKLSEKLNNPDILEAPFVIGSNDQYHKIVREVKEETGSLDSKRVFFSWNEWLKRTVKKINMA